jgi:hypothetical protein
MRNPVKEQPLVDLTVELHGRLARCAIDVVEMNRQINAWASSQSEQLLAAGVRNNMTWYAQSLSVLEFLLEREGRAFVRQLAEQLREGARMEDLGRSGPKGPAGSTPSRGSGPTWWRLAPCRRPARSSPDEPRDGKGFSSNRKRLALRSREPGGGK